MVHRFDREAIYLIEELGAGVSGGEGFLSFIEFLGKAMDFGELMAGLDAGRFGNVGAFYFESELLENGEAFLHVLMKTGVVKEILSGADGNFVIGVFRDEEAEGLLGVGDLSHLAISISHAISGDGGFVGFRPVVDDRLKAFAKRGLGLFEIHHGVAPHQLCVGSAGALFVEC